MIAIFLGNVLFLFKWVAYFLSDVRAILAEKKVKLFTVLCLCCRSRHLEREQLKVKKESQNEQIINTFTDIAAGTLHLTTLDAERMARKYKRGEKFRDKWELERFALDFQELFNTFDI